MTVDTIISGRKAETESAGREKTPAGCHKSPTSKNAVPAHATTPHTIRTMRKSESARLTRSAAIRLVLSVALVVGGSCLVLQSTVWRNPKPEAPEPFYTELPGVDLSGMPADRKEALLKRLNVQRCPCDCMRTIASCRNHHDSCSLSLAVARRGVEVAGKR